MSRCLAEMPIIPISTKALGNRAPSARRGTLRPWGAHTPWGSDALATVTPMWPAPPQVAPRPPAPAWNNQHSGAVCRISAVPQWASFCSNSTSSSPPPPAFKLLLASGEGVTVSMGQGVHWWGDSDERSCAVPIPLIPGLFSPLRYHLPSVEKGGEWKPEPRDPLHHHPH